MSELKIITINGQTYLGTHGSKAKLITGLKINGRSVGEGTIADYLEDQLMGNLEVVNYSSGSTVSIVNLTASQQDAYAVALQRMHRARELAENFATLQAFRELGKR